MPLGARQPGVQNRHAREPREEPSGRLRRQRDLRHEHNRAELRIARQRRFEQPHVNFSLARARHTSDQMNTKPAKRRRDRAADRVLLIGELRRRRFVRGRHLRQRIVVARDFLARGGLQRAGGDELLDRWERDAGNGCGEGFGGEGEECAVGGRHKLKRFR